MAAVGFRDGDVVDAGVALAHQPVGGERPHLVAVAAPPLAGVVVPFILEAHGDAVGGEGPQLLPQAIVELLGPFAPQELLDRGAAGEELAAVAPLRILGVGERDALGIAAVPGILGGLDLGLRAVSGEGRLDVRRRAGHGPVTPLSAGARAASCASSSAMRACRRPTTATTSASSSLRGMCWGQLTSHASTVNSSTCSGRAR